MPALIKGWIEILFFFYAHFHPYVKVIGYFVSCMLMRETLQCDMLLYCVMWTSLSSDLKHGLDILWETMSWNVYLWTLGSGQVSWLSQRLSGTGTHRTKTGTVWVLREREAKSAERGTDVILQPLEASNCVCGISLSTICNSELTIKKKM